MIDVYTDIVFRFARNENGTLPEPSVSYDDNYGGEVLSTKRVADIMTPKVLVIDAYSTVADAAKKMKEFDVGALAVMSADSIVGLLTDRDIVVRALAESKALDSIKVEEIMSPNPITCKANDNVEHAAELFMIHKVHRLLVVDESNKAAGILSLGDLAIETEESEIIRNVLKGISEEGKEDWSRARQSAPEAKRDIPTP